MARLRYLTGMPTAFHQELIHDFQLRDEFDPETLREVDHWLANPGLTDPNLLDLTGLPFVTIDGATSRDLDQALAIERRGEGYRVHYALADAAYYVSPTSRLFGEALLRGASFYLPGRSVPMLPRALSEGLISLNPKVDRRAVVFSTDLDAAGEVVTTEVRRGRIHSRAKLAWGDVQGLYDRPDTSPLGAESFRESLELLREVGEKRMHLSDLADVVRYKRRELDISVAEKTCSVVCVESVRDRVELYNEQLSLLCNREGGRILAESRVPNVEPIYRVHPAPDPEKLTALRGFLSAFARLRGLNPARWTLGPGESLAALVRRLPSADGERGAGRAARAIERQAILVNMRSALSTEPRQHFGVGAEVYARFSAPMREVVGIFLHKEMIEHLRGAESPSASVDLELRERVVDSANRARETQRKLNDRINRMVIDALLRPDLSRQTRPVRVGTVMGITQSKVHVELDEPGIDLKVYVRDLGQARGGAWLELRDDGVTLGVRGKEEIVCRVGDAVALETVSHDVAQDRWVFAMRPA